MSIVSLLDLPEDWTMKPLGRIAPRVQVTGRSDLQALSVFLDEGVVPRASREDNFNRLGEDLDRYLVVEPGDIVFNKLRTWQGGLGVSAYEGIVSPAYFVCRPINEVEPRYLHYLLRSVPYLQELTRISKWMPPSQFDISWEQLRQLPVPLPQLPSQQAIADYLDAETARIDALIEKKTQMASLLHERLTRLSSEAVSHGPRVRVRHLTSLITSGPRGWAEHVSDEGTPFIRSANLRAGSIEIRTDNLAYVQVPDTAESRRSSVCSGDVVIGITGANLGWLGIVPDRLAGSFVSQHVAILRPSGVNPEWLANALAADEAQDQLLGGQYGGTKQQLGLEDLAELRIGFPGEEVQRNAVALLRATRDSHGALHERLEQQVRLLQDHRQALITAAVTGELRITGAAA